MLNFSKYLTEAKKPSQAKTAETASDDKGKLHELLLAKHLLINGISPNIKYTELRMLINNFLDSQLSEIAFAHLSTFREVINDFKKFLSLVQLDVLPEIAIIYPLTA